MKYLVFIALSAFSIAEAKVCNVSVAPLKPMVGYLGVNKDSSVLREVPRKGNCKLVKDDVLKGHNSSCDQVLTSINSSISNTKKKYECSVSALGSSKRKVNNMYSQSYYEICYVCKPEQSYLFR